MREILCRSEAGFRRNNCAYFKKSQRNCGRKAPQSAEDAFNQCFLKATLYENYIDNLISKKDYRDLKTHYTEQAEQAQRAIDLFRKEMERTMNSASDRLRWTQHFKAFSAMAALDRRTVIAMVHSIKVMGKNDLEITFRYQMEFMQVLERLEKSGKIAPRYW